MIAISSSLAYVFGGLCIIALIAVIALCIVSALHSMRTRPRYVSARCPKCGTVHDVVVDVDG